MSQSKTENYIDAVITWVDGNDANFINRKNQYQKTEPKNQYSAEEFGEHRYIDAGEIEYALNSILRNAPFIKTIYIVHCQTRLVEKLLANITPKGCEEKIKSVHHSVIYEGYEEYLPTFNSLSIETMLHRIPGLSEKYIYFNDDFLLLRETCPTDFFKQNIPISSGYLARPKSIPVRYDSYKAMSSKTVGFVIPMKNIIKAIKGSDNDFFVRLYHSPYVFRKSTLVNFFKENDRALRENIIHKFRSYDQFSTAALAATLEYRKERVKPIKLFRHIYLKPVGQFYGYCSLKILPYSLFKRVLFGCIQNLSESRSTTRTFLKKWLDAQIYKNQKPKRIIF